MNLDMFHKAFPINYSFHVCRYLEQYYCTIFFGGIFHIDLTNCDILFSVVHNEIF